MRHPDVRSLGDHYEKSLAPGERKLSGSFYTPEYVTRFIARETLGALIGDKLGGRRILDLRVLDPAMGAGHFLAAAAEYLGRAYKDACRREGVPPEPTFRRTILERCLYGVDSDAQAVDIARRSLWLLSGEPGEPSPRLNANLACGDALLGGWPGEPSRAAGRFHFDAAFAEVFDGPEAGFSAIIGNPPYLRELDHRRRFAEVRGSALGERYANSKMNLWYFFAHRSLQLLAPDGVHSFVCPAYWPWSDSAARLIAHIAEAHYVSLFVDFGRNRVFDDVADRSSLYVLKSRRSVTEPQSLCVLFEPGLAAGQIAGGLEALPKAIAGTTRVLRRPWIEVALTPGRLQLGVQTTAGPRAIQDSIPLSELGLVVTQGIAQNPDRVSARNIRSAAAHYGVSSAQLLQEHGVAIGDGVFVLSGAEVEALGLSAEERTLLGPFFAAEDLRLLTGLPANDKWLIYSAAETSANVRASERLFGHLERYRFLMELRRETRAGRRPWWEMHWPRRREWFCGPRLVVPQMSARPAFTYAVEPGFVNLSVNVMVCPNTVAAQVLWAVLNGPETTASLAASTKRRGLNIDLGVARIRDIPVPAALPWTRILAGVETVSAAVEAFNAVRAVEAAGSNEGIGEALAAAERSLWSPGGSTKSRR